MGKKEAPAFVSPNLFPTSFCPSVSVPSDVAILPPILSLNFSFSLQFPTLLEPKPMPPLFVDCSGSSQTLPHNPPSASPSSRAHAVNDDFPNCISLAPLSCLDAFCGSGSFSSALQCTTVSFTISTQPRWSGLDPRQPICHSSDSLCAP